MRSARPSNRVRSWLVTLAPLLLSFALVLLPAGTKEGLARLLEWSVFYPYRFALGWGPRSLGAERQAARLQREMAGRRWSLDSAMEGQAENARLRRLLGFNRRADVPLSPATVVGRGRARLGDLLIIAPADPKAVEPGLAVVSPDGLIGRVAAVEGRLARVECLTHLNMAVSVINQRSREGGILKWSPERPALAVDGIPAQSDWQVGDRLITSGYGTAFPRGILVGWVTAEKREEGGLLKTLRVRPAARISRAEEVFLLLPALAAGEAGAAEDGRDVSALYPIDSAGRARKLPIKGGVGAAAGPTPVP